MLYVWQKRFYIMVAVICVFLLAVVIAGSFIHFSSWAEQYAWYVVLPIIIITLCFCIWVFIETKIDRKRRKAGLKGL